MMFLIYSVFISTSIALKFVEIRWNNTYEVMNEVSYSKLQREEGFCDLTVGVCDNLCCSDEDCTETQKLSFNCHEKKVQHEDLELSCKSAKSPSWMTFLCYTNENSPYLGMFFPKIDIIQDLEQLKRIFPKRFHPASIGVNAYKYRDPVMTFLSEEDKKLVPLMLPNSITPGSKFCVTSAVKFMENVTADCERDLTKYSCENDENLSMGTFLVQSNVSYGPIIIVSNILTMGTINASSLIFKASSKEFVGKENPKFNEELKVCENVVTSVRLDFLVDGNVLKNLSMFFTISVKALGRVRQKFSVSFRQSRVILENGERFYKRGYVVGDELQSGFLR